MGFDVYYQFFDRDAADRLLGMRWRQVIADHPKELDSIGDLLDFAFDEEPSPQEILRILETRTVGWTMRRSSPQYHFLAEVLYSKWGARKSCRHVNCDPWEHPVLLAAAVDGFIQRRIKRPALHSVFKLNAISFPTDWLKLTRREQRLVSQGWDPDQLARPIYRWQGAAAHLDSDGDTGLGVVETRRLLDFLHKAWDQNWEIPRLIPETIERRKGRSANPPRFREFQIARDLHKALLHWNVRRPSAFRRSE